MANLGFSIRSTFGLIPKTDKIEAQREALKTEYEKLQAFTNSDLLKEYLDLKTLVNSTDFKDNKKHILGLNFKNTEEFKKEQQFIKLSKDKRIKNYFKVLESAEYKAFLSTEDSNELDEYKELQAYLESPEHANIKQTLADNLAAEHEKEKKYKALSKFSDIKNYFKIEKSAQLALYLELNNSDELKEYMDLKEFVESNQLLELKTALAEQLISEKNKKKELKQLAKNPDLRAYKKLKDKSKAEKPQALKDFEELQKYLSSQEYQQKLNELDYKNTDAFTKEQKFNKLKKDSRFKRYFKFEASQQLSFYNAFKTSDTLKTYQELKTYLTSDAYTQNLAAADYKNSDGYKKEQRYQDLAKSNQIKTWIKYQKSKAYLLFKSVENSDLIHEYQELDEFLKSDKFKEFKAYMLDKEKWQKTDNYQKELRFQELEKDDDIIWYFKVKDSDKFNELLGWNLTFEDDFNSGKIDDSKWMNSFFWGKMLLNDRYVLAGDKHFYTDNKNLELNGTTVKIVTKKEKTSGKVWDPIHGFYTDNFEYTSGMLSTAHSFRQQYGRFEAKIKINANYPVYQAFWMKGEKITPEIDVFKFNMDRKNRFQFSNIWGQSKNERVSSKLNGNPLAKDFHIYTLDWTPEKISWKINGFEVYTSTQNIPDEPLYLILSAGIQKNAEPQELPSSFEIDWVRCYEKTL